MEMEASMDVYEIRILRDRFGALHYSAPQPNDLSAIQQANRYRATLMVSRYGVA